MLIIFNMTGLNKWYWLPKFHGRRSPGIWFFTIRWLGVETSVFNKCMGAELLHQLNEKVLHPRV